jgi:hypothetical protein
VHAHESRFFWQGVRAPPPSAPGVGAVRELVRRQLAEVRASSAGELAQHSIA